MVSWMKVLGGNFSINYLLLALYSVEDLKIVGAVLSSYNYEFWDNLDYVRNLVVDFISYKKEAII